MEVVVIPRQEKRGLRISQVGGQKSDLVKPASEPIDPFLPYNKGRFTALSGG